jgi:uncharacterized membrane protein
MAEPKPAAPAVATPRVAAIDLFRFFILFLMVQGHLFRALLQPGIRSRGWFLVHEIVHGAVAPGFLFSAGFVAYLSFMRKFGHDHTLWSRMRKAFFVIALGYTLHLPFFSLGKSLAFIAARQADGFFTTDVLQCIGISLILFALISHYLPHEGTVVWGSGLLVAFFFTMTHVIEHVNIHFTINPYLHHELSFFPIFPWSGFLFLGILAAYGYRHLDQRRFMWLLGLTGLVLIPWLFFQPDITKPELTVSGLCNKTGSVFLLLALALAISPRLKGPLTKFLSAVGQETLFFYTLHLFVIYGSILNDGLVQIYGETISLPRGVLLCLLLEVAIFALTWAYHWLKSRHRLVWRVAFYLTWIIFLYQFVKRPY